ncbi:hypothetical protein BSK66_28575 [Paenibacillus odorifer]|uniref:Uncharacterized protein n=1 Tax=Paenibacillus odorifer TaxID=189426 RepID=A0A1R0WZC9_9BACL|nr:MULTISPECIES: hypothetical protein [Paenibacillus]ETT63712.1 hypothetical protein C171_09758 [Paenibacillus sp. FSL H8-237]OMD24982.1 hypothetical protein BJP51_28500 [Paenibacillus odorifer]OME48418.1 hypothetical protein BSK66_28575 [Paenibacillus odorifer]
MIYIETKNYIFSEIGKRVHTKKDELNLTYYQLAGYRNMDDYVGHQNTSVEDSKEDNNAVKQKKYGKYDLSIIKNIAGGKAYAKKNPNLISDSLLLYLTEKLKFSSEFEFLWGDFENSDLSKVLFHKVLIDVLYGDDDELKKLYNNVLFDYVPYAEYHSYWQMFVMGEIEIPKFPNSQLSIPSYFYNLNEDQISDKYESIQKNAIEFLYFKCRKQIHSSLVDFIIQEGDSLKKLDKKLDYFISHLTSFIEKYVPNEDSLGLRARNIIISDYRKFGTLIAKEMKDSPWTLVEHTLKLLVESSLAYITELKRVQSIELEVIKGYIFSGKEKGDDVD